MRYVLAYANPALQLRGVSVVDNAQLSAQMQASLIASPLITLKGQSRWVKTATAELQAKVVL